MSAPQVDTEAYDSHAAQPSPAQDTTTRDVGELLLVGASVTLAAAAIFALLHRRGFPVSRAAVLAACVLADHGTAHQPRMVGSTSGVRAQRRLEAYFRAAYIINAAKRLTAAVKAGQAPNDALRGERRFWRMHEQARKRRMAAVKVIADKADLYGDLLGWYTIRDGHETPECKAAAGSNFRLSDPPAIGLPGTLHGGTCRCEGGPPHARGVSTDEATMHLFTRGAHA